MSDVTGDRYIGHPQSRSENFNSVQKLARVASCGILARSARGNPEATLVQDGPSKSAVRGKVYCAQITTGLPGVCKSLSASDYFGFVCRRRIIHAESTAASTTATADHNGHYDSVADDDHRGPIQHGQLDHHECNVGDDQSGHSPRRCHQYAAQRPRIGNASTDDDLYADRDRAERHSYGYRDSNGKPGSADDYVLSFADRSVVAWLVHLDLVNGQCDFTEYRSRSGFGLTGIGKCDRFQYHGDNDFHRNRDWSRRDCNSDGHGICFPGGRHIVCNAKHDCLWRHGDPHLDSE